LEWLLGHLGSIVHGDVALAVCRLVLGVVVQAVLGGVLWAFRLQALNQHVLPDLGGGIPIFHYAIFVHVVSDLEVGAGEQVFIAINVVDWFLGDMAIE
jgi:hypothetical protein